MKKKLNGILLIDDDDDCNFFHQRLLQKMDCTENIYTVYNGREALDFLAGTINGRHPMPEIIFLDINMPVMNGWEFLDAYEKLDENVKGRIVLIMLTTSLNPDDKERASKHKTVRGFTTKYLDKEAVNKILHENFTEYL